MVSWVTHLMIADKVLERFSGLDRRGFCVGNIAPDCNVENEDWTEFPNYIDYFPEGAIVRKIGVMGYIPQREVSRYPYLAMSEDEYKCFVNRAAELVIDFTRNSMV